VKWIPGAFIASALLAAGCAAPAHATRELTLGPAQVVERVEGRSDRIRAVKGDGVLTIESPEQSGSSSFDIRLKKPDSMLVSRFKWLRCSCTRRFQAVWALIPR